MGGLGNQMFQYAAGRALAERHNTELLLDLSWFEKCKGATQRTYALSIFPLKAAIATKRQIDTLLGKERSLLKRVKRRLRRGNVKSRSYVMEPQRNYWGAFADTPNDVYLDGYWQAEKYFAEIGPLLRKELLFPEPKDKPNILMLERIKSAQNSVFLHIRRGDYVNSSVHGVDLKHYYHKAIQFIGDQMNSPKIFVFSDDPIWAEQYWGEKNCVHCVNINDDANAWKDMYLMTQCRHAIIANSSFSWWGAWLQSWNDHMVTAPSNWFLDENSNNDRFPNRWVVL